MAKTFTGAEFAKVLAAGGLRSPVVLTGMAKPAEHDAGAIMFSPAGCESWVRVPVDLIESAEHLGESACKDHTHPHVRIHLKESVGKSPEGMILAAILKVGGLSGIGGSSKPQPQPWRQTGRGGFDPLCAAECAQDCGSDYPDGGSGYWKCMAICDRVCWRNR